MSEKSNVCFCICHESGRSRCVRCRSLHLSTDGVKTHENDSENPNIEDEDK